MYRDEVAYCLLYLLFSTAGVATLTAVALFEHDTKDIFAAYDIVHPLTWAAAVITALPIVVVYFLACVVPRCALSVLLLLSLNAIRLVFSLIARSTCGLDACVCCGVAKPLERICFFVTVFFLSTISASVALEERVLLFYAICGLFALCALSFVVADDTVCGVTTAARREPPQASPGTKPFEETQCPICLCGMETEKTSVLPCRHQFHAACIRLWFVQKPHCPQCNACYH